ncbi:hypothetical protein L7F22_059808 [Adiantum nelumboides]|nr:hypothetical protein [Adiantum nelumboides]
MGNHNFVREVQASHLGSYTTMRSYSVAEKLGVVCLLLSPLLTLHSRLATLYHHPHSLLLTPAFTFLSFNLIALLIITTSIMSSPHKNKSIPPHMLQFPFTPIHTSPFPCNITSVCPRTPRRLVLTRSISCQNLTKPSPQTPPFSRAQVLSRSPSHNTYLTLPTIATSRLPILEDLTDEEANKRFSAFIESRLAIMRNEVLD